MIAHSWLLFLLGGIFTAVLTIILNHQTRLTDRRIDEATAFFQATDDALVAELLDPFGEMIYRFPIFGDRKNSAHRQRIRLEKFRDQLRRRYHNARISYEWGKTNSRFLTKKYPKLAGFERDGEYSLACHRAAMLREKAFFFCLAAQWGLAEIWLLCLLWHWTPAVFWRFTPIPSVARYRRILGYPIVEGYAALKHAVGAASLNYVSDLVTVLPSLM